MELIDFVRMIADEDTALPWEIAKLHAWFSALAAHNEPDEPEAWASIPEIRFTYENGADSRTRVYVHDGRHHGSARVHFFDVDDQELADIAIEIRYRI